MVPRFLAEPAARLRTSRTARGATDLILHPQVVDFYRRRLDERSADLAPFERIVRFPLLPEPLTVEAGEITPTMKVRRKAAAERHRAAIDATYSDG